jgi:NitT/TauT family transport system substrate-binding protein
MNKLIALLVSLPLVCGSMAFAQEGVGGLAADAELVETLTEVPKIKAAAPYQMKDGVLEIELSEYAGYSGLIAANGGLAPNDNSVFAKKHGFKVKITLSEEESWSALNSGRIGVSATTVDVLAVYGKQFQVVVPAQIGFSRGADAVLVRQNIKRINDLKGKVLAVPQFTEADFFLRYLVQEAGLEVNMLKDLKSPADPGKVNLVFTADAEGSAAIFARDVKAGRNRLAGASSWAPFTTSTVEENTGKIRQLASNQNLLVVADILVVNKGFADANPKIIAGLVEGMLEGNQMVRNNPDVHLDTLIKAFNTGKDPVKDKDDLWDKPSTKQELAKVHLANLPENLAFFSGAIDAAGSFGGIYQSAIYAYGTDLIKNPVDGEKFLALAHLQEIEKSGQFKDQKIAIAPIRSQVGGPVEGDPLLSKDIRFLFEPNSSNLDMKDSDNLKNLEVIKKLLQVSPGSTVLLRGHVDNARVEEFRRRGGEAFVRQMALKAMELSKNRSNEVKKQLVQAQKVDAARVDTVGVGWQEPLGTDQTANRRVEVQWFTVE